MSLGSGDARGDQPRRVVSLVPSATETLLAWGIVPAAVTRFCEHPELPQVGGTKNPDVDAIVALEPDLVVMCREENRAEDADALAARNVRVHDISPASVAQVAPALDALAAAVGLVGDQRPAIEPVPAGAPVGCSAFVPIWRRPWMTINDATYGSSVLAAIGVSNVFGPVGTDVAGDAARYPVVELDDAVDRRPDLVLAPSEPYAWKPRHLEQLAEVAPVVEVDGQDLFWWGARTPAAVARLHDAVTDALAGPHR